VNFALLLLVAAQVESGPKVGEKVPALKVSVVVGELEGKEVDIVGERKELPTAYLLVNADKFSRPMARFLRDLDGKLADVDEKASAVAVWVGGDFDKNKSYLPKAQQSLKFGKLSLAAVAEEPKDWNFNADAHLTAVLTAKGKVVKTVGFVSVNDTDVKPLVEAWKAALRK
jgi:hypothetical protein